MELFGNTRATLSPKEISSRRDKIKDFIELSRHVVGGRGISMNCWRLLDAVASRSHYSDTKKMLEVLTNLRYCKPSNAILGPLVRVHLNQ